MIVFTAIGAGLVGAFVCSVLGMVLGEYYAKWTRPELDMAKIECAMGGGCGGVIVGAIAGVAFAILGGP